MRIVGNAAALAQIPDPLPHALLLTGPEGVGKRRVAYGLALGRTEVSHMDFQNLGVLTVEGAQRLIAHHATHPLQGEVKVSVADLTHATPQAANAILKVLEQPAEYTRIVLHSDHEPLLTIRSRCFNVRFGTLSVAEVATVLDRLGVSDPMEAARFSRGRVSVGLDYAHNRVARKSAEDVLTAISRGSAARVEQALAKALGAEKNATPEQAEIRRTVLCRLLAQSLRASLAAEDHPLSAFPVAQRIKALRILDGDARPSLRARSAAWVLLSS